MIALGDCRTVLPTLPAASVQTCLTHPPYWQAHGDDDLGGETTRAAYHTHLVDALHDVHRVLTPTGDLWLLLDSRAVLPALLADGWRWTATIRIHTDWLLHFGPRALTLPTRDDAGHDPIISFAHYQALWSTALVSRCLHASTVAGDVVLDPFCGIGTTGRVALRAGRRFVGIECDPITYAAACAYVR